MEVRTLTAADRPVLPALAAILIDCVARGASVSYLPPLSASTANGFFENSLNQAVAGERILLAAFNGPNPIGTVQVVLAMPENQQHRADIAKLLVHPAYRGRGIGKALMLAAESAASAAGKTLLVLDTAAGVGAGTLYECLGYTMAGTIPDFAQLPDGTLCATVIYWKRLSPLAP